MTRLLKNLNTRCGKLVLAAAASAMVLPSIAAAQNRNDHYDRGDRYDHRDDRHDDHVNVRINLGGPVYERAPDRVWVEPAYRTVCDQVWVEPVYQTIVDRVWVEPCYETRDVVHNDGWHRRVVRENVLVRPGHWEEHPRQVLVSAGYFRNVERQELVAAGHWEYRGGPAHVERSGWSLGFGFFGH